MRTDQQGPAGTTRYIVSQSEVATFLRCENKHKYSYGLDLDLPGGSGSSAAMQFGTACHYAFEQAYNGLNDDESDWLNNALNALAYLQARGYYVYKGVQQPLDKISPQDWDRIEEVVRAYYLNMLLGGHYDDLTGDYHFSAEVTGVTHIAGNLYLEHTFDLVRMSENSTPAIIDHKFRGRVAADELIHLAPQNMMYSWAAWKMYGEPCDMIVNTVQSKPPSMRLGKKAVTDYYRRDVFFHSEAQLETFGRIILDAAATIVDRAIDFRTKGNQQVRRTMIANGSDSCLWCPYRLVCEQELDGLMSKEDIITALSGDEIQESDIQ